MKQTVVIIDDDPDDIELMTEALSNPDLDVEIISFTDCSEAYNKITRGAVFPNIILLDINMPIIEVMNA